MSISFIDSSGFELEFFDHVYFLRLTSGSHLDEIPVVEHPLGQEAQCPFLIVIPLLEFLGSTYPLF